MSDDTCLFDFTRLAALFAPRSIAVVGASDQRGKIGGIPLDYLLRFGYGGALYAVNPRASRVQDLPTHEQLDAIGAPADLAIVAVPQALAQRAQAAGIRLIGPNCLGFMRPGHQVYATFSPAPGGGPVRPGRIGMVSQSGAFGAYAYSLARERGLGLSLWATTGNEADVQLADGLAWLAQDPETDVIMAYMEGCSDGPRLRAALALAQERGKPVVMCKVGTSAPRAPRGRSIGLFTVSGGVGAIIDGARGCAPADLDSIANTLLALARFAQRAGETLDSAEINPLITRPHADGGCMAVDALVIGREAA